MDLDAWLSILGSGGLATWLMFSIRSSFRERKARIEDWTRAASELGLSIDSNLYSGRITLEGQVSGATVVATYTKTGKRSDEGSVVIYVRAARRIPFSLTRPTFNVLDWGSKDAGPGTGDVLFDGTLRIEGNAAHARAVLSRHMRKNLLQLQVELIDGKMTCERKEWIGGNELISTIRTLIRFTEDVHVSEEALGQQLLRTFVEERDPLVKRAIFTSRTDRYVDAQSCHEICVAAMGSPDHELKSLGAEQLGERGHKALLEVAKADSAADTARARAIGELPLELLDPVELAKLLGKYPGILTRIAIARRLGRFDSSTEVEDGLLTLLDDDAVEVCVAAANALSGNGTRRAIERLMTQRDGVFKSADLSRAARTAIEAIQRRGGGDRGLLSVSSVDGGELSGVDSEHGQLSNTDDKKR